MKIPLQSVVPYQESNISDQFVKRTPLFSLVKMLGLHGNASSPKVYRCVACSATFTGLASLLVHQASHASEVHHEKHSLSPKPSPRAHLFSVNSDERHSTIHPPQTSASSHFICDCGCEFKDFDLMMEHKKTHVSEPQMPRGWATAGGADVGDCSQPPSPALQPTLNQSIISHKPPSYSMPLSSDTSSSNLPTINSKFPSTEVDSKEGLFILTVPSEGISPMHSLTEEDQSSSKNISATDEPSLDAVQSPEGKNNPDPCNNDSIKNKTIMKMLATAYMKRFQPLQPSFRNIKRPVIPKTEIVPVEITSTSKSEASPTTSSSVDQLRRLLTKSGAKTKTRAFNSCSSTNILCLTKTFCPVVVLETRQKLIDFSNMSAQGSYQCGRCKRVFKELDSLTEHHATHRKEKVKCCRLCKQLVIGKPSLPDNHICPQLSNKGLLPTARSKFALTKNMSFHHQKTHHYKQQHRGFLHASTRKLFYCPLCKHSYTRRYSLKKHKCIGQLTSNHVSVPPLTNRVVIKMGSNVAEIREGSQISNSIGVGTDIVRCVKGEVITKDLPVGSQLPGLAWSGTPKSFLPFSPKSSSEHVTSGEKETSAEDWEADLYNSDQGEGLEGVETAGCSQSGEKDEGQWTVPLDNETEVLIDADDADNSDVEQQEPQPQVELVSTKNQKMPFFIKDGVKRYPCNKCPKTYSRGATLRRHQRLCGRVRSYVPQAVFGAVHQKVMKGKQLFDCFVCGKSFNRKDNMMVHRRKCQLRRTVGGMDNGQHSYSASNSLSLLGAKSEALDQNQGDNGSNWGIMSLPSVLPRRVTCECGAGFTSPQLLLEHLQKHAQESYTCPTCGETLSSWADYEVHLQVHMQPHHQQYHGVQLQRSQPLLLRFQQHPLPPPSIPKQQLALKKPSLSGQRSSAHLPPKQPSLPKSKQRSLCMRCNNTFSTRSSLIKHLSLNRCKGVQSAVADRTNHCSRCNMDFPNALSLKFHQRSGMCKPAFKPMRCPVCVRWFGTVEGLQKHLPTHNQSNSFTCLVCQRVYLSLKSLKDHSRKVHKIRAGDIVPVTQVKI